MFLLCNESTIKMKLFFFIICSSFFLHSSTSTNVHWNGLRWSPTGNSLIIVHKLLSSHKQSYDLTISSKQYRFHDTVRRKVHCMQTIGSSIHHIGVVYFRIIVNIMLHFYRASLLTSQVIQRHTYTSIKIKKNVKSITKNKFI